MKRFLTLTLLAVACLCSVAAAQEGNEECGPTETPWGTPCYIEASECTPMVRSLFVVGAREETIVRIVVNYSSETVSNEQIIPWADVADVLRFEAKNMQPHANRIRWYSKWIDDPEFPETPLMDCWCEPTTGEIERCVNGKREED